jgi:hypothetical protein
MSSYTSPRLDPLNDHQLRILRALAKRGRAGVPPREVGTSKSWSPITMYALERRGLAKLMCDRRPVVEPGMRDPVDKPVPGSWRWVATLQGQERARQEHAA